jgi:6-phosphogluconolactonase (cycloisomerase 2 family)
MRSSIGALLLVSLASACLSACGGEPEIPADGQSAVGFVFVGTNHNNTQDAGEPANQVTVYRRFADGSLELADHVDTGGQGSGPSARFAGDGLGSSHSMVLSQDRAFLLVTNAGSDSLSVLRVGKDTLEVTDVQPTSDGAGPGFPNSVTQHGDLVYALNGAGEGSVTGFRLSDQGKLTPIPGSTRLLSANQASPPDTLFNPAQASFTPNGRQLVVTIKDGPAAGLIDGVTPTGPSRVLVFDVLDDGQLAETFTRTDLDNDGPFGFSFDAAGHLLTAMFVGGDDLAGAAGSFQINADGTLTPITRTAKVSQLDPCWLENNGEFAFTANYTSGTISSFRIGDDGSLTVLDEQAGLTDERAGTPGASQQGSTPLDLGISPDGRFLYDVLPGSGSVGAWRIEGDGRLTKIGEYGGLPRTVDGDRAPEERFGPGGSPAGIGVL